MEHVKYLGGRGKGGAQKSKVMNTGVIFFLSLEYFLLDNETTIYKYKIKLQTINTSTIGSFSVNDVM